MLNPAEDGVSRVFHIRTLLVVTAAALVATPALAQTRTYRTPTPLDAGIGENACGENLACDEELVGGDEESRPNPSQDERPVRVLTVRSSHIPADAPEYGEHDVHFDIWVDVDAADYANDDHGRHHEDDDGRPHDEDRPRH